MKEIIVTEKYHNKKLNTFVLNTFPNLNPNILYKAIRKKDIRINGNKINENVEIHVNDKITLFITDDLLFGFSSSLCVIYEDENILILDKPTGISVTENRNLEPTLTSLVHKQFSSFLEPCHRLDRNTYGLILYAKNKTALSILLQKFKNHEIEKHYQTTVLRNFCQKTCYFNCLSFQRQQKKSGLYFRCSQKKLHKNHYRIHCDFRKSEKQHQRA